jgi:hypothetical protein
VNAAAFKDLETRGFVLIPSFLSESEVRECAEDFGKRPVEAGNRNYGISLASRDLNERLMGRVQEVLGSVAASTNLRPNFPMGASYFATGNGIKFSWHQDHESFFSIQNHYDYLNFYIPVVKPRRDKSNLSIIPFDALEQESPATYRKVVRSGAARFLRYKTKRMVFLDDEGAVHLMPGDLNRIAHTPMLSPGDLLLLRGDIIHRTQDAETERVALSFRVANADTPVHRSRLTRGGWFKARMMMNNVGFYERMYRAFDEAGQDAIPMVQLRSIMSTVTVPKPKGSREFLRYLIAQKRREGVLLRFVRRTATSVLADRAVTLDERFRHS